MDEASSIPDDSWSLSYLPGDWTLVAVPAALVVLEPAPARASAMVAEVWRRVLSAGSASQLIRHLSEVGLGAMPTMAVVFRDDAGVHALLRGAVDLVGPDGERLGDGRGADPWRGLDLSGGRCRLRLAAPSPDLPELPIAMGVARVAEVLVDAGDGPIAPLAGSGREAQAEPEAPAEPEEQAEPAGQAEPPAPSEESEPPEPAPPSDDAPDVAHPVDEVLPPGPVMWDEADEPPAGVRQAAREWSDADAEPVTLPDVGTRDRQSVGAGAAAGPERSASVRLVTSSGEVVDVDRPVVIGRAPTAQGSDPESRLITVPSPSHDISRTHVRVTPGESGLEVTDLHSTNGTILVAPDGTAIRLAPGRTAPLPVGSTIDLGDGQTVEVVDFRAV